MARYKINKEIGGTEFRVIDEKGVNLGIMKREDAFRLAQEKELDVVEISAIAKPPVIKIINFDKFRYQKEKEERKQKIAQKTKELKKVRITPRAAENDLQIKLKRLNKFLSSGHKVEIGIFLRGREKRNREWALEKLESFINMIDEPYIMTLPPRKGGRGFIAQVSPKNKQ